MNQKDENKVNLFALWGSGRESHTLFDESLGKYNLRRFDRFFALTGSYRINVFQVFVAKSCYSITRCKTNHCTQCGIMRNRATNYRPHQYRTQTEQCTAKNTENEITEKKKKKKWVNEEFQLVDLWPWMWLMKMMSNDGGLPVCNFLFNIERL